MGRKGEALEEVKYVPIYEYECTKCGQRFELRRKIDDKDDEIACPRCRAVGPRRMLSLFGTRSSGIGFEPSSSSCAESGSG